jgi:hypothetical protein
MLIAIPALLLGLAASPDGAGTYLGAARCGACHPAQLATQSSTGHARALAPASGHRLASAFVSGRALRRGEYDSRFSLERGALKVIVSAGSRRLEVPVDWAFGSGTHAVTLVSQLDEDSYVEHAWSYYPAGGVLERTPGHADTRAASLRGALGVVYRTFDPEPAILRCFRCHSTGPLSLGEKLEVRPAEPGVRCEICHGPGGAHAASAAGGDVEAARRAIRNPGRASASELNDLCGACHRQPAPAGAATNWNDPWNVRHQPLYLAESACFQKSRGALSCLTCHDPHRPLRPADAAAYNGRCAVCHGVKPHPPVTVAARAGQCTACHMPRVEPRPHLRFTNHWIGVYRRGGSLKPAR